MKPLILTGWLIPDFTKSDFADLAVGFFFRFVWGALPAPRELKTYFGARMPDQAPGHHWSDFSGGWGQSKNKSRRDLGLAEFCRQYETVELWFDMEKLWGGRRRSWHLHRPNEPMEVAPWPKSMISAEA